APGDDPGRCVVIRSSDRISRVLERDERLIDVLIDASPNFERLRDPRLRKVMSRLVTVAAAARIAGVDERDLVERLNRALSDSRPESSPATDDSVRPDRSESTTTSLPPDLANVPRERIVDLDVREDLRAGREPFSRIM